MCQPYLGFKSHYELENKLLRITGLLLNFPIYEVICNLNLSARTNQIKLVYCPRGRRHLAQCLHKIHELAQPVFLLISQCSSDASPPRNF